MVIIATQDDQHLDPALAFIEAGYDVLLEKPIAPNEADCRRIVEAATAAGRMFGVCHVLRYTAYTQTLKSALDAGLIGDIVSVQHLEPVGYWHQAHSFVRGNWRREDESSFMLLAKSCHDLDWLQYIVGRPITRVSSFGGLAHFRPENRPADAADRCLDCAVEPTCPYSAKKIYFQALATRGPGWPIDILTKDATPEGVEEALRTGPYGRCVYACDNDVVDHQVVNLEFAGGPTAVFTMTAFSAASQRRQTRIFGTKGELEGDSHTIKIHDFLTDTTQVLTPPTPTGSSTHGGGDDALMDAFTQAVATRDPSHIRSGATESLNSHLAVFAAEQARHSGTVVTLADNLTSPSR